MAMIRSSPSLAALQATCSARGIRLTINRKRILKILHKAHRPLSAYEIIAHLSRSLGKPVGPPSVYRVLELLVKKSLLVRLESRNAYVLCSHLDHDHEHVIFSCRLCGQTWECPDASIRTLLADHAEKIDFITEHQVIELSGLCGGCRA